MPLAGRPMIAWSVAAFRESDSVGSLVVACPPGRGEELLPAPEEDGAGLAIAVVDGGATRAESVSNALGEVGTELVAIHDAARPLLAPELVEELVARLDTDPGAAGVIAAAPVADTIKQVGSDSTAIETTLDRRRLWAAQTPQVFRVDALRAALAVGPTARDAATDEAMLVEAAGGVVLIHHCEAPNLKVTTPLDLRVAELLLHERAL